MADCRFLYLRAEFSDETAPTLQKAIQTALTRTAAMPGTAKWKNRRLTLSGNDDDEGECLLINHVRGHSRPDTNNIFGDLCRYRPGGRLATILEEDNTDELQIDLLPPSERKQFLNGIFYWRVSNNDVLIVQSRTVRWRSFEIYLKWLLTEQTNVLTQSTGFRLTQDVKIASNGGVVKALSVSGEVSSPAAAMRSAGRAAQEDARPSVLRRMGGPLLGALRAAFPTDIGLQRILDKIPDGDTISVEIKLRFPGSRKIPSNITVTDVYSALDTLDEAQVSAITDSGPVEIGALLQRPECKLPVISHGGIWDRDDLYRVSSEAWVLLRDRGFLGPRQLPPDRHGR